MAIWWLLPAFVGLVGVLMLVGGVARVFKAQLGGGLLRVLFGAAGWEPYVGNLFFWLKMAAFAATGLISVVPTRAIIAWRRAAEANPAYQPPLDEVRAARNYVVLGAAVLALVPGFAAAITRL